MTARGGARSANPIRGNRAAATESACALQGTQVKFLNAMGNSARQARAKRRRDCCGERRQARITLANVRS